MNSSRRPEIILIFSQETLSSLIADDSISVFINDQIVKFTKVSDLLSQMNPYLLYDSAHSYLNLPICPMLLTPREIWIRSLFRRRSDLSRPLFLRHTVHAAFPVAFSHCINALALLWVLLSWCTWQKPVAPGRPKIPVLMFRFYHSDSASRWENLCKSLIRTLAVRH